MDRQKDIATGSEATSSHPSNFQSMPGGMSFDEEELRLMQQFLEDPAHDYPNFQYGDTVDGTIVRIDRDSLLVDIGAKAEGVVPLREMQSLTQEERDALAIGDILLVSVVQGEHVEGHAILSVDKARQERSWRQLQKSHETDDIITAHVINYNKGGLLVSLDGVRGFVPASQVMHISRGPDTQKQSEMARMVGAELQLKVIEINRARNRLILSERQAVQDAREEKKDELLATISEGDMHSGVVSSVCDFGAFVDIGGADGLVHLSELSWGRVKHPGEILQVGDTVQVYVLSVDNDRRRIALSLKRTQREPWSTVSERYHLGQIVEGTITQIASFGAFARIEDGIEGLIHISELDEGHVQHPRDVVHEGQTIPVRIIRIDPSRKRMGLSLRIQTEASANGTSEQAPVLEQAAPQADQPHPENEVTSSESNDSSAQDQGDDTDTHPYAAQLVEHDNDLDSPEALPEREKSDV